MNRRLVPVVGLLLFIPAALCAEDVKHPLIQAIGNAWKSRQEQFKTFVIEWEQQETYAKGTLGDKDGKPYPSADVTQVVAYSLSGSGNRLHLTRKGMKWDPQPEVRDFAMSSFVRSFNGRENRQVYHLPFMGNHPAGSIDVSPTFSDTDWKLQPAVWSFRPVSTAFGQMDLANWRVTGRKKTINGAVCHVLERQSMPRGADHLIYVAEDDYRIVSREYYANRIEVVNVTAEYADSEFGLVCKSWTIMDRLANGVVEMTITVPKVVLRLNESLSPAQLQLKFTPGTVVTHRQAKVNAVVKKDGSLRVVTDAELRAGKGWDEYMKTDPPPGTPPFPDEQAPPE